MITGRRAAIFSALSVALFASLPGAAAAQLRAGAAAVDATWHVGASAGQYAGDCFTEGPDDFEHGCNFVSHEDGTFDPTGHSIRRRPSYGIQSRLSVRALVIEGSNGARHAIVKNDQYIPQDLVYRRAAQLLEQRGRCGITRETLTMAVTHNHSSPMYSSTSWGVWAFQDVFDVRFFNYLAERMYRAVERACADLVPARVGAAVGRFSKTPRHSYGPARGDDGTPAGYPHSNTDRDLTVIRFDDLSGRRPRPLANLVNYSLHPEFLEGNDLISADYLGPLERMADRETRALTVFTQGAVGTAEPERSVWHDVSKRLEFSHRDYAQAEFGARLMANKVVRLWRGIGSARGARRGRSTEHRRLIAPIRRAPLASLDRWYPGPFSHPYPGVSSCRTDKGLAGDPQLPIIGLPDCNGLDDALGTIADVFDVDNPAEETLPAFDPGLSTDDFEAAGIPVPENYSAPSYTGLEEDIDIHLQAVRIGPILLTICSCEQWFDQSQNIETRTDRIAGNEHLGFGWAKACGVTESNWSCPDPLADLGFPGKHELERMRAQVFNPANGWNNAENTLAAESEPVDPAEIKGNFTHDDRCSSNPHRPANDPCRGDAVPVSARLGYRLTVPIGMANDYNGYIASYREYQRGDHYRKALTGWGPHSSDYMATRLVTMGRLLRDPELVLPLDQRQESALAAKATIDTAVNDARAAALGELGAAVTDAYEALLPADAGEPEALEQPADVERFGASFFSWLGGSNFTDDPVAVVQQRRRGEWRRYADMSGEVPVTLRFPAYDEAFDYLAGSHRWRWTAHFEAFVSPFDTGRRARATPAGIYRFVVRGKRSTGGMAEPYRIASERFRVRPWRGITVRKLVQRRDGRIAFRAGPSAIRTAGEVSERIGPIDYPDSYDSPARFIRREWQFFADPDDPARGEWFCFTCTFRPWLDAGRAARATVTIVKRSGNRRRLTAVRRGPRWVTRGPARGVRAYVARGAVRDRFGNFNGERSKVVALGR